MDNDEDPKGDGNKRQLVIATTNIGKVEEIKSAFACLGFQFLTLSDFPEIREVEETGTTYAQNAILKAQGYARQTSLLTLADDSGLEVDGLNSMPGVTSARYFGRGASEEERIEQLLHELGSRQEASRRARFVCCIAISAPTRDDEGVALIELARGECNGHIANEPRGDHGFGYDPIFVPDGYNVTFGQLPSVVKATISHRAGALRVIRDLLACWLNEVDR